MNSFQLKSCLAALALPCCLQTPVFADDSLQATLNDNRVSERWIYNDWDEARKVALRDRKPILALFR